MAITAEAKRRHNLYARYRIREDQLVELHNNQDGRCAICHVELCIALDTEPNAFKACVDHDHVSGHIRGLLCSPCNIMLGRAQDDPIVLESAILYLHNSSVSKLEEVSREEKIQDAEEGRDGNA